MESSLRDKGADERLKKELIKGIVYLSRHKEFYGHIVQQLQKVYVHSDHKIQTASVGRFPGERFIKMHLNLDFFANIFKGDDRDISWKYMCGILEHEILHIVFGHLFVHLEDRCRANVAFDCVVNAIIEPDDKGDNLPSFGGKKQYIHPAHYNFPTDKSALWYYTHLRDNEKFKQQCASGAFGVGGILSHVMSSHSSWEDLKDDVVAKEFAKDIIRKAKDLCGKNYGNIPGEVIEQIDELLKKERAIVPWAKVLRMFVATAAESVLDYTVKRRSKRFGTRPGTRKGDVLNIAVAIDTSGSIDDWQLKMFWNEIRWIWKNGAKVWIYECDTEISERSPFLFRGRWDGEVHGRGGTDLEPPLRESEGNYDALIYFTDFYAPKIEHRYKIPVLWVLTTEYEKEDYPYPWGRHIKIEEGKAHAA